MTTPARDSDPPPTPTQHPTPRIRARGWALDRPLGRLRDLRAELTLFLGYALIVLRPGALPPQHPQAAPPNPSVPDGWHQADYLLYIEEARREMDQQQTDRTEVRTRAQIVLTTTLVLGGALAAAGGSRSSGGLDPAATILYTLSAALTTVTGLAAGGIITARSAVGAPNLRNLLAAPSGTVDRTLAIEYAATRFEGAATVAVLVTVLRNCVLTLILAAVVFGCAYVWA